MTPSTVWRRRKLCRPVARSGDRAILFLESRTTARMACALDDGFGNLTEQDVIKGSAPTMHVVHNASLFPARRTTDRRLCAAVNRQTGDVADGNGNLGSGYVYDISNRLMQASGTTLKYAYAADNKRVCRGDGTNLGESAYWSPAGQKHARDHVVVSDSATGFNLTG